MEHVSLDLSHLAKNRRFSAGTTTADGLFMYSIVKMCVPKTIVEFGFCRGYSAINFLHAMPDDAKLFSFDPSPESLDYAKLVDDERFKYFN